MFPNRQMLLILPILIIASGACSAASAADAPPPPCRLVPEDAVMSVTLKKPKAVLHLLLRPRLIEAIESSPQYKTQAATKGFKDFRGLVKLLEQRLETDWRSIIRRLVGRGVTWAIDPRGDSLLIVDAIDGEVLKETHDLLLLVINAEAKKNGAAGAVTPIKYAGAAIWSIGPNAAHAVVGKRLILANSIPRVKAALDLMTKKDGKSLAAVPAYRKAIGDAPKAAAVTAYVNTAALKRIPAIAASLKASANPLLALLTGPITQALAASTHMSISLTVRNDTLTIDAISNGTAPAIGPLRFAAANTPTGGAAANLVTPRRIAAMSLHRDLQAFYASKDKLFGERTSGLIFFENMMGIFFTGRDLGKEVLGQTAPKIRLVVAEQKYDPSEGAPSVQFPAAALVLEMKDPKKFAPILEEAWQKAIGLVNFTRGQKAQPGLVIDRPVHRETKYTVAGFTTPGAGDPQDANVRLNVRPTLAMPGNYAILSSSETLARDIMDALAKESAAAPKQLAGVHSLLELSGTQLASILKANCRNLVRRNMVEKGHTLKQAQTEVDSLITLARTMSHMTLSVGADKARSKISLEIRLNLPSGKTGEKK